MFPSNAPADYICPVCLGIQRSSSEQTLIKPSDIVYSDDVVTVLINSFVMGQNKGAIIVVPNTHHENIYDLPSEVGHHIFDIAKKMAIAIKKAYKADGITIRQNNEPASDQHAFHYHMHVVPRYNDDGYNKVTPAQKRLAEPKERAGYAEKLKTELAHK